MRLDLVVKTSGHLTQSLCLSWSSSPAQKSHSTRDRVQPSENPDCYYWCLHKFPCSGSPYIHMHILIFFLSVSLCDYENYSSRNTSQALCFDFWQKQSELAFLEVNNYGIKIEARLRCLLRFWIIVPVPSRFLVNCGKLRQIQLVTLPSGARWVVLTLKSD